MVYSLEPSSHKVLIGLASNKFNGQVDIPQLKSMRGSHLIGPIEMAFDLFLLYQLVEHKNRA